MTNQRFYRGHDDGRTVSIIRYDAAGKPIMSATVGLDTLPIRIDVVERSSRFGWGGYGPDAQQLAAALLADTIGDKHRAVALMLPFVDRVIARLPARQPWIVSDNIVRAIAGSIAQEAVPV